MAHQKHREGISHRTWESREGSQVPFGEGATCPELGRIGRYWLGRKGFGGKNAFTGGSKHYMQRPKGMKEYDAFGAL